MTIYTLVLCADVVYLADLAIINKRTYLLVPCLHRQLLQSLLRLGRISLGHINDSLIDLHWILQTKAVILHTEPAVSDHSILIRNQCAQLLDFPVAS
jgi:hypothetical protein